MPESEQKSFWFNVLKAVEADPKAATSIRGASGIVHTVVAIGVDEGRRRLLVISGEHDARTAAMTQIDIQAALEHTQVLVARPLALDCTVLAKGIVQVTGRDTFAPGEMFAKPETLKPVLEKAFAPLNYISHIPLNVLAQFMNSLQQLAYINYNTTKDAGLKKTVVGIDLRRLAALDPLEGDNHFGVCPVPLYTFTAEEVSLLNGDPNLDDVRELLSGHNILQYFFPAADQLALGLVDRSSVRSTQSVMDQLALAPEIGHPYGGLECLLAVLHLCIRMFGRCPNMPPLWIARLKFGPNCWRLAGVVPKKRGWWSALASSWPAWSERKSSK